ncbi:hypothetical protein [Streptomyces sp. DSM 40907]|uniref:hypothetical protein n=1 Tax=Streptomyces kutzneri TaxID=3051179 RepID=UPI0028CFF7A7|nr:hypothetical protein [Streptomyces sp. DSM 40907]
MRRGDFHSAGDALLVGWIGMAAFAVYGIALTIAARSYWLRTRPACRTRADTQWPSAAGRINSRSPAEQVRLQRRG